MQKLSSFTYMFLASCNMQMSECNLVETCTKQCQNIFHPFGNKSLGDCK